MTEPIIGIIANPASGKDIRRLVALGSSVDNVEKVNIVRRVLAGLSAMGIGRIAYLPDGFGIASRAAGLSQFPEATPLPMDCFNVPSDSQEAAARLAEMGAAAIVTLGGDGTNRMVAKGCGTVPIMPISTGTNNVFPTQVEGTIAGIAVGAVARGVTQAHDGGKVVVRQPRIVVTIDGNDDDMALIDAVTTKNSWIGARAVWRPHDIGTIVLSRVVPGSIGMASFGSVLFPDDRAHLKGVSVELDANAERRVLVPLAPGVVVEAGIAEARTLGDGDVVDVRADEAFTIALDGEREIEILDPRRAVQFRRSADGPFTVDAVAAVRGAAAQGLLAPA